MTMTLLIYTPIKIKAKKLSASVIISCLEENKTDVTKSRLSVYKDQLSVCVSSKKKVLV